MKTGLVLTLGHGASAVYIQDNKILDGYQLERITGIKGDSRFPALCIEEIEKTCFIPKDVTIYVSHWEPTGDVNKLMEKYWNKSYLIQKYPDHEMFVTTPYFTHHDAHAYSAIAYNDSMIQENEFIMVADGFGNLGEVLSIYVMDNGAPSLLKRVFGYNNSLGLLYQYATDYVGMTQNRDEWKLNAYANLLHLNRIDKVRDLATRYSATMIDRHMNSITLGDDDPVVSLGALSYTHKRVVDLLSSNFSTDDKAGIAYFLQTVIRNVLIFWINHYKMENLTLAGGCFLNVQLNGELGTQLKSICVMPLSGDEGAGLGVYKFINPEFRIPDSLCWGNRDIEDIDADAFLSSPRIRFTTEIEDALERELIRDHIVNVVRGTMEFGPRAYCNTSTIALPTVKNKKYINMLNDRDPQMPMCPVVTDEQFEEIFDTPCTVIRSLEHMIMAVKVKDKYLGEWPGVTYNLLNGDVTARPQVVSKGVWIYDLVDNQGPFINTSFNNHGQPIVRSMDDVLRAHRYMLANDKEKRVVTLIDISETNKRLSG